MRIFVINATARSGKTTFGEYVGKLLSEKGISFLHDSSILPVKRYLKEHGWDGKIWDGETKDEFWRNAMYSCKCWMIENDPHVFDRYAVDLVLEMAKDDPRAVLFFDIREPHNIEQLKEYISISAPQVEFKTVFIERDAAPSINTPVDSKSSGSEVVIDTSVNPIAYEYDIVIDNNGTLEELFTKSESFVNEYVLKDDEKTKEFRQKA